jgi:glycosyltransferase 2 family protein
MVEGKPNPDFPCGGAVPPQGTRLSFAVNYLRSAGSNVWVRYCLTCLVLALVVIKVRPQSILSALATVNPAYVLLAAPLTVPFLYMKILRWHLMLRYGQIEATWGEAVRSLVGGMGLALVTPARLGELVRVAYLRDPQKWKIGGLVMIDKAFDVLVLAGLSIIGAAALLGPSLAILLTIAFATGLLVVYFPRQLSRILHLASNRLPFYQTLERIWSSLDTLSVRSTTLFLALTLLAFVFVFLQYGVLLLSWHQWSFGIILLTIPLVILTNVVPATVGGLGVREGAAALLLAHYGVTPANAAVAAFLSFSLNTLLPGVIGVMVPVATSPGGRPLPTADRC